MRAPPLRRQPSLNDPAAIIPTIPPHSQLGSYYERLPGGGRSLFGPRDDPRIAELTALRVYVADEAPPQFRLDGLTWKSD